MQFVYDNYGNRTEKNIETSDFTAPISYNDENWDYTYDVYNRMNYIEKDSNPVATWTFNALGNRVKKFVNSGSLTTKMLYDGADCVADYDSYDSLLRYYITPLLDENLLLNDGSEDFYFTHDGLGSVRQILDSSQNTENDYDFYSFGTSNTSSETITNRFKFTGREFDTETGSANSTALYYYRARTYDSEIGSFTSRDPIPSLNLYTYCYANPITFIDPSGLQYCGGGSEEGWKEYAKQQQKSRNKKPITEEERAAEYVKHMKGANGLTEEKTESQRRKETVDSGELIISLLRAFPFASSLEKAKNAKTVEEFFEALAEGLLDVLALKAFQVIGKGLTANKVRFGKTNVKLADPVKTKSPAKTCSKTSNKPVNSCNKSKKIWYETWDGFYWPESISGSRRKFWKTEALFRPFEYTEEQLARMRKGLAPKYSKELPVSKELHHKVPLRLGGKNTPDNLLPLWPWEHAKIDPFRHYKGPIPFGKLKLK